MFINVYNTAYQVKGYVNTTWVLYALSALAMFINVDKTAYRVKGYVKYYMSVVWTECISHVY